MHYSTKPSKRLVTQLPFSSTRCRDPQLQVGKNYSHRYNLNQIIWKITYIIYSLNQNICQSRKCNVHFSFLFSRLKDKQEG